MIHVGWMFSINIRLGLSTLLMLDKTLDLILEIRWLAPIKSYLKGGGE